VEVRPLTAFELSQLAAPILAYRLEKNASVEWAFREEFESLCSDSLSNARKLYAKAHEEMEQELQDRT